MKCNEYLVRISVRISFPLLWSEVISHFLVPSCGEEDMFLERSISSLWLQKIFRTMRKFTFICELSSHFSVQCKNQSVIPCLLAQETPTKLISFNCLSFGYHLFRIIGKIDFSRTLIIQITFEKNVGALLNFFFASNNVWPILFFNNLRSSG